MSSRKQQKTFIKTLRTLADGLPETFYPVGLYEVKEDQVYRVADIQGLSPVNHYSRLEKLLQQSNGDMQPVGNYVKEVRDLVKPRIIPVYNSFGNWAANQHLNFLTHQTI